MSRLLENDAGSCEITDDSSNCSPEQLEPMELINPLLQGHQVDHIVSALMTLTVNAIILCTDDNEKVLHLDQLSQSLDEVKKQYVQ